MHVVTRPGLGQLLGLAWPIIISRSAQVVIGFVDAAMVAVLGETAMAAATTGSMNTFTVFILPMGTVFIVSSFSSQLAGRGDHAGARRYGFYGLGVAALAQLLCFAVIPFLDSALSLMAFKDDVRPLIVQYIGIRLLTGGAAVGLEALGNYYGGLKNTLLPMAAQVLAMVLNVALNWVLIFGTLGAPAMGVKGAALASAIATGVAFAALLGCFLLGIGAPRSARSPLRIRELGRLVRFGLPVGFNWFIEFAAFMFFVDVVVAGLGTLQLAAMMAVIQLNSISFMPAFGLTSAGAIFVGQAIGAKKHDDVPFTVRLTLMTTASWQGLVAITYLIAPLVWLAPLRGTQGQAFIDVAARVLMVSAAWQLFDAAVNTLAEALRAAGDTAFTFWARAAIGWGIFVPGTLFCVRVLGWTEVGASLWLVVYLGLLALVLAWRFRSGRWRTLEITEPTAVVA